jgi:hypothetical protein
VSDPHRSLQTLDVPILKDIPDEARTRFEMKPVAARDNPGCILPTVLELDETVVQFGRD